MQFWRDYTPQELESLIKKNPLTEDRVNFILQNKIERIRFSKIATGFFITPDNGKYRILIPLQVSLEERESGLVHEISHAYYEAGGPRVSWLNPEWEKVEKIEELIDKEAQRFYKKDKEFVKQLYSRLSSQSIN